MDNLLDTSWTLHYTSTLTTSYQNLFNPSTTTAHLSRYFDRLPTFLSSQTPQYKDDLNDASEKLGSLRDCKYTLHPLPSTSTSTSTQSQSQQQYIQLLLIYQHATLKFTLFTPHLLLTKAPTPQTKHITTFLSETFNITLDPLKLPSSLVCSTLQSYISTLTAPFLDATTAAASGSTSDEDGLTTEGRVALLKSVIGNLKLTVSFAGPVAPHLRTLELGVPGETVDVLVTRARGEGVPFLRCLAGHVHLQTGLRLPLEGEGEDEEVGGGGGEHAGSVTTESMMGAALRVSKVAAAAFVVSVDGKVRFAARAVEGALEHEDLVVAANMGVLEGFVEEAKRRREAER